MLKRGSQDCVYNLQMDIIKGSQINSSIRYRGKRRL